MQDSKSQVIEISSILANQSFMNVNVIIVVNIFVTHILFVDFVLKHVELDDF